MGTQRALGSSSSQPALVKRWALCSPRAKGAFVGVGCPVGAWDVGACARDGGAIKGDGVGVVCGDGVEGMAEQVLESEVADSCIATAIEKGELPSLPTLSAVHSTANNSATRMRKSGASGVLSSSAACRMVASNGAV
jgi:hypothetical protein